MSEIRPPASDVQEVVHSEPMSVAFSTGGTRQIADGHPDTGLVAVPIVAESRAAASKPISQGRPTPASFTPAASFVTAASVGGFAAPLQRRERRQQQRVRASPTRDRRVSP